jgi:hypothetical protein
LVSQLVVLQFVPSVKAQSTVGSSTGIKLIQGPTNPPIVASNNTNYSIMVNGTYQAYFKSNSKTSKSVRFQNKGYTFDMDISTSQLHWYNSTLNAIIGMKQEMNPQNTAINASGNMVIYKNAWINTTLQYQAYSDELKETLIIRAVSAPSSSIKPDYLQYVANCYYNNSLTIYANGIGYLHPTNQKFITNGTINFNDANNITVFYLPQPHVYDSVGNQTTGFYAVTANNGILIINIRVPKTFIDKAVFPVYFDPITRVQGNARGTGTTSVSVTMASTPTNGNVLVAVIGMNSYSASRTVSSITQTGVTWTYQIRKGAVYNVYMSVEIWLGVVGSGASKSVAVALSGEAELGAVADICEYSGVATSSFLDKTATNSGHNAATNTGTTDTTTQANELWIGGTAAATYTQSTPTNDFTLLDGAVYSFVSCAYLEKIVSSTGAANSGTTMSTAYDWVGCIATFKAAAAGGYALNLCIKDWDLTDAISGAIVYKDTDTKTSNGGGWANWTGVSGTVAVKVKYYGFWVNGTFNINVDADKTINIKCKLYDVTVTAKPNNEIGVISGANVTAYNNTGNSNGKIKSGITATITGQVTLTNVPNATLRFIMYAKSDYSIIIANTTQLISSDDYSFNIIGNQNYATITLSSDYSIIIWISGLTVSSFLVIAFIMIYRKFRKQKGSEKTCMQRKYV